MSDDQFILEPHYKGKQQIYVCAVPLIVQSHSPGLQKALHPDCSTGELFGLNNTIPNSDSVLFRFKYNNDSNWK